MSSVKDRWLEQAMQKTSEDYRREAEDLRLQARALEGQIGHKTIDEILLRKQLLLSESLVAATLALVAKP
jgi:hypothetical protein